MKIENYRLRIINDKLVLINIFLANDVMVFEGISKIIILRLIDGENIEKIIDTIVKKYKVSSKNVERDVYSFIEELKHLGIYNEESN